MECCFWLRRTAKGYKNSWFSAWTPVVWRGKTVRSKKDCYIQIYIYRSEQKYSYGLGFLLRAVLLTVWNVKKTSCSHRATCCAFLNRRMFVLSRFLHFVHMAQLHLTLSIFIECCRIQNMNGMERQSVGVNEYAFQGVSVKKCEHSDQNYGIYHQSH
jgi:hypothetical protein